MRNKVLVTGSDGYIGTVLCGKLQDEFDITGLDTGYYRNDYLYAPLWNLPRTITKDVRHVTVEDLQDVEAVICLSDLNDPLSQAYPDIIRKTNFAGPARFATLCKEVGVKRFIYSSSASVYGFAADSVMDETSKLNPLTPYAECKAKMEDHLLSLCDERFSVACMRNSTVYGPSPSIRFDLVINYLCGTAVAKNTIELKSDGGAWRPFVHINDVCNAFISILKLPVADMSGLVVNVGNGDKGNYRVIDIAEIIHELTGCKIIVNNSNKDKRSYRISSSKLEQLGIKCSKDLKTEITNMIEFFKRIRLTEQDLNSSTFTRLEQIRYLITTRQIDEDLFWSRNE